MEKMMIAGIITILVIIALAGIFLVQNSAAPAATPNGALGVRNPNYVNSSAVAFNTSQYAPFSYLIFPNASQNFAAHAATSDFVMSARPTGTDAVLVTLNFSGSGVTYNVTVQPGEKLYFIDSNLGDDGPVGDHAYTGDDGYALTDQNGYIVTVVYPLARS